MISKCWHCIEPDEKRPFSFRKRNGFSLIGYEGEPKMTVTLLRFEKFYPQAQNYSSKMIPFFNPENFPFLNEFYSSIMTGDDSSPSENKEPFNYGRSTPPPTTSYLATKQEPSEAKSAAEPNAEVKEKEKEKDKDKEKEKEKEKDDKDEIDILRPDLNPGHHESGEQKQRKDDSNRDKDSRDDKDRPSKSENGPDKLDGQWIPPKDCKFKEDEEEEAEDESCTVKCLYYTMQCCECSIS